MRELKMRAGAAGAVEREELVDAYERVMLLCTRLRRQVTRKLRTSCGDSDGCRTRQSAPVDAAVEQNVSIRKAESQVALAVALDDLDAGGSVRFAFRSTEG